MRLRVVIRGAVQGVGFRPFVYHLATELGLHGWVRNSPQGVFIEVEGGREVLEAFLIRLPREQPPRGFIQSLEPTWLSDAGRRGFEILESHAEGEQSALVLPDIATCADCLREVLDPNDRRHLYPFTNCTHCGPRFSIIEALPYDRANTSMKAFTMCAVCRAEYENPANRRFHAQPNACPDCGPQLEWWRGQRPVRHRQEALQAAARMLREGGIVAVKGLGGFHLMCLASNDDAVRALRERKHREEKPFAVMFPTMDDVLRVCEVSPLEHHLLTSPESPIVLLRQVGSATMVPERRALLSHGGTRSAPPEPCSALQPFASGVQCASHDLEKFRSVINPLVAPGNPMLGVMLPYTPLHYLLLREVGAPVVATSGNLSDEPICVDEHEARERLAGIADGFLVHSRPIVRHVDDSIVRVVAGREMMLRRARGYAPLPIALESGADIPHSALRTPRSEVVLSVGAHLKNTVALAVGNQVFLSQHVGDLETEQALTACQRVAADLQTMLAAKAGRVAVDLHPDYLSTRHAMNSGLPVTHVQHHAAHVLACMAENELEPPTLGVAWDGTGFGPDGTVWGGEFIRVDRTPAGSLVWQRVAHLKPFPLPGGEAAVKEPRRSSLGLLFEVYGARAFELESVPMLTAFTRSELTALRSMLERNVNSPRTSSIGRLFDAVASLAGLRQLTRFEGQAAMELEFAAEDYGSEDVYPFPIVEPSRNDKTGHTRAAPWLLDPAFLVEGILDDVKQGAPAGRVAAKFHAALAGSVVAVADRLGVKQVALSGGCFQNRRLIEGTVGMLAERGFQPFWHQRVPPNDGGIALGQVAAALWRLCSNV